MSNLEILCHKLNSDYDAYVEDLLHKSSREVFEKAYTVIIFKEICSFFDCLEEDSEFSEVCDTYAKLEHPLGDLYDAWLSYGSGSIIADFMDCLKTTVKISAFGG